MKMSNKTYETLKWLVLIAIPALCTFLGVMLPSIGVDAQTIANIITILTAFGAFIGTLIGISTARYNSEVKKDV